MIAGLTINRPSTDNVGLFGYIDPGGRVNNLTLAGGSVTGGTYYIGGLVGCNSNDPIADCYATGLVSVGVADGDGLVGYGADSWVTSSYWNTQTSGQSHSDGGTGKTTAKMKQQATFQPSGGTGPNDWDFVAVWAISADINNGYPYLMAPPAPYKRITPSPANGATGQAVHVTLGWHDGGRATSYDVYFGTENPPVTRLAAAQTGTAYTLRSLLSYGTTYYWRIDAKNLIGTTTGNVWSFTTTPTLPSHQRPTVWVISSRGSRHPDTNGSRITRNAE
jgi:hypothetical protein